MKKVKSVDHALEILGQQIDFEKLRSGMLAAGMPEQNVEPLIAHYQITKIIEANNKLNSNWKANWANSNQRKYCVWQWVVANADKPAGFGLSSTVYANWLTATHVGSRLLVGTSQEAIYIGTDFIELFEIAWLIIEQAESK